MPQPLHRMLRDLGPLRNSLGCHDPPVTIACSQDHHSNACLLQLATELTTEGGRIASVPPAGGIKLGPLTRTLNKPLVNFKFAEYIHRNLTNDYKTNAGWSRSQAGIMRVAVMEA